MADEIAQAVAAGVEALGRMQAEDGSFPLWMGVTQWRPCGRVFSTAYVMIGAGGLLPPERIARAIDFIRRQRRPDGLWDYDPALRVPPDSDTTACALAALVTHDTAFDVTGAAALLRAFWREPDGPFRSWPAAGAWSLPERDDPVVNCNVLFALRLLNAPATATETASVDRLLARTGGIPRYYCSPATVAHAARRAGMDIGALPAAATARPEPADLIGAVQWLCATGVRDEALIAAVLAARSPDGSWPIRPWVTGVARPKPYWGSAAVTTALAIEGLRRVNDGS
jgi:hypothetical protein